MENIYIIWVVGNILILNIIIYFMILIINVWIKIVVYFVIYDILLLVLGFINNFWILKYIVCYKVY